MFDAISPPAAGPDALPPADDFTATFSGGGNFFDGALEDGIYDVTLADMARVTSPNTFEPGETRVQIRWSFTVDGQEPAGKLDLYTSFSMHEKSKLPGVLAALGIPAPTPESPGIGKKDALLGKKARAFVENVPSKRDPSRSFPRITKLVAKKGTK